jgi:hypothetical protein
MLGLLSCQCKEVIEAEAAKAGDLVVNPRLSLASVVHPHRG